VAGRRLWTLKEMLTGLFFKGRTGSGGEENRLFKQGGGKKGYMEKKKSHRLKGWKGSGSEVGTTGRKERGKIYSL